MYNPDLSEPDALHDGAAAEAQAALAEVLARKPTGKTLLDKWRLVMAAIADPELSANAKAMLPVILDEYQGARGYARRGYRFLGNKAGMTERTARRAVHDLVEAGYVLKRVDRRGSASEVNQYKPVWAKDMRPDLAAPQDDDVWPDLATGGGISGHRGEAHLANRLPLGSTPAYPDGSIEPSGIKSPEGGAQAPAPAPTRGPAFASREGKSGKASAKADKVAQPVKTSLPVDWQPDAETSEAARSKLGAQYDSTLGKFVQHFAVENVNRRFVDWNGRFRKWIDEDAEKAGRQGRGTTMPEGWWPSDADIAEAQKTRKTTMRADTEAFVAHHTTGAGCNVRCGDWSKTWVARMIELDRRARAKSSAV